MKMRKFIVAFILIFGSITIGCKKDDFYNLGILNARQGNHEKAIYYFTKVIEQSPNDYEAYYNRAYSQQLIGGKEHKIIEDYSKSLELNPKDYEAHLFRGFTYLKLGKIGKAIDDYKKSIEIEPKYSLGYFNLGNAYMLKNDMTNACLNWKISSDLGNQHGKQMFESNCR